MMTAYSQNGWEALASNSSKLHTWNLGDTLIRDRNGSAGFLLMHLASRFDRRVEQLKEPVLDDWGYAYRAIRGYATGLSNHSSGTAIDLNATDHPLGVEGTFTQPEVRIIHKLLSLYDGCIRWGGDYRGRKDAMHFEIDEDLATCERKARELMDSPRGKYILSLNPGQAKVILS